MTAPDLIIDLYAGARGWSEGLRLLGLGDVGIEWMPEACATAVLAGHPTIRADLHDYPPQPCSTLIASPPCQTVSTAGKGEGVEHLPRLAHQAELGDWSDEGLDDRTRHILVPGRWIDASGCTTVMLEQVPAVLPVWQGYARWLRGKGWSTWAGILNAADFGVPQTRRRAFLIASCLREVTAPEPTHCKGGAVSLFGELAPWVSMAEALGWGMTDRTAFTVPSHSNGGGPDGFGGSGARAGARREQEEGRWADAPQLVNSRKNGATRSGDEPAMTLTGRGPVNGDLAWVVRTGANSEQAGGELVPYERSMDEPAPTVDSKVGGSWQLNTGMDWKPGEDRASAQTIPLENPAPAITGKSGGQWQFSTVDGYEPPTVGEFPDGCPECGDGWEHHDEGGFCAGPCGGNRCHGRQFIQLRDHESDGDWWEDRPATTLAGDPRVFPPGGHMANDGRDNAAMVGRSENTIRLEVPDALVLQSFRRDMEVCGSKTMQFLQIGNAVPPRLAAHVACAALGLDPAVIR